MKLRLKRALIGGNVLLVVALAGLLTVMTNYLAVKHRIRFDFSPDRYYTLSGVTLNMLGRLDVTVKATVFLDMDHELFSDIKRLLKEYEYASEKFKTEYVDPHRDVARAKELALQYDVPGPGVIVFQANDKTKVIAASELATYDYAPVLAGHSKAMMSFRGEQSFSSAIYGLMQDRKPVVYFLAGHGEHRLDDFSQYAGYSMIGRLLEKGNINIKTLQFADSPSIPKDCDVLVISGLKRPLAHVEAEIIKKYLDDSGRLLFLADTGTETGLEKNLEAWGVRLGTDRVVGSTTLTGRELLVNNYGAHPITEPLKNMITIFNLPRSVQPVIPVGQSADQSADKPRVVILAANSEEGWAEMSYYQNPPKFDAGVDRRGPIPVAVAVEKGNLPVNIEIKPTRIVVIGDSTFVSNGALLARYSPDFFINALNWLLERKDAPTFTPKIPSKIRLNIDRKRMQAVYIMTVVIMPALVAMIGLVVSLRRRK